ncbi:MAG: regulatory protein RecX [Spirochaetaceae bacterium]|jgi:regulatory protein|nr:regulatory protein RecX [Spirochaetaceae bacterium]
MDKREPEESSSSPSVKIHISTIQERGNSGTLYQVHLSEGSSFFMAPELLLSQDSWLLPHAEIDETRLNRLIQIDQETRCRKKALDLLARRDHSRLELSRKLRQRDFPKEMVEGSCRWLQEKGFLDDLEFGHRWLEYQKRRGKDNRQSLYVKLQQKGLSRSNISILLDDFSQKDERTACKKALEKIMRRSSMTPEKAEQTLRRRGYHYNMIKSVMSEEQR